MDSAAQARAAGSEGAATPSVTVRIPGEPVAWQRPRARVFNDRAQFFEHAKPRSWKGAAQEHMERAMLAAGYYEPMRGPLEVTIVAVWALPKTKERKKPVPRRWRPQRPDCDQVAKLVLDMGNAVAWLDDAQVCRCTVETWTGAQGEPPSVTVEVRAL